MSREDQIGTASEVPNLMPERMSLEDATQTLLFCAKLNPNKFRKEQDFHHHPSMAKFEEAASVVAGYVI